MCVPFAVIPSSVVALGLAPVVLGPDPVVNRWGAVRPALVVAPALVNLTTHRLRGWKLV